MKPMMTRQYAMQVMMAAALLALLAPSFAQAQGYDGLVADDGGNATSAVISPAPQQGGTQEKDVLGDNYKKVFGEEGENIHAPDYHKKRAELIRAARQSYRDYAKTQAGAAAAARAAGAKADQEAIAARVKAAIAAPSTYDTRVDALKAPPPQASEGETPSGTAVTPVSGTTGGATGKPNGKDPVEAGGGSVLERMMNALQ